MQVSAVHICLKTFLSLCSPPCAPRPGQHLLQHLLRCSTLPLKKEVPYFQAVPKLPLCTHFSNSGKVIFFARQKTRFGVDHHHRSPLIGLMTMKCMDTVYKYVQIVFKAEFPKIDT